MIKMIYRSNPKTIVSIDESITDEFVYSVLINVESKIATCCYQTTFNLKQPETAIKRAVKLSGIQDKDIIKITVTKISQLGFSQIK